jgi:phenylacetate-coenzyme A ligase PaaK-like adenylate-forming protein
MIAAQDPTHATAAISQTFSDPSSSVWHRLAITSPFEQIVETLNSIQPDVLASYPSMLHRLAFAAGQGGLRIAPRLLFCTAEPLLPEIKDELNAAWPVPLINMWASTETGPMASSCGAGPGLHLSDDNVIIEAVDRNDQAVPIGVRSAKVLVTGLFSPAPLPLIRYEITDQVTLLDEPCTCGVTHRRLADVQGRLDDDFDYGPIHVHAHLFRSRLGKERHIVEYQVRQSASGALIDVCCNGVVDMRALRDQLISDLRRAGLQVPEVAITAVPRIERPVSGKLKRFVTLTA